MSQDRDHEPRQDRFESLRRRGQKAIRLGDLESARSLFQGALELARQLGDPSRTEQAQCGLSAVRIELGEGDTCLRELAQILLRRRDPGTSFLAAYNLARAHELRHELRRARFYARAAHDHAHLADRADWLAASHNQLGALLLVDSYFDQAILHLEQALEHLPDDAAVERALVLDNLGYCHLMLGRERRGFELLYRSLRALRRHKARRYEIYPRLSLCWGLLERDRPRLALGHGAIALGLADALGDDHSIKQALFLLGEAHKGLGDLPSALARFRRLQRAFYPDDPELPSTLLAINSLQLVNLKA